MVMKRFVLNIILLKNNIQEMHLLYTLNERSLFTIGDKKANQNHLTML